MDSYHDLLIDVMENGERHADRTGTGTRSVFGRQWRHDMRQGFPLLTTKKVPLRWVFEELRWFLSGSTWEQDLADEGVDIWREWATAEECQRFGRQPGDLGPIYGKQWRSFGDGGFDQIAQLLGDISASPNSRRLIVTGWHPEQARLVSLPPCHTLYQLKCHDDRSMSLSLYARSIDIFLGLPFNIASYGLLLHMIAAVAGYTPRDLVISFGDLHLYNNHLDQAYVQLSRSPRDLPTLSISDDCCSESATVLDNLLAIRWQHIKLENYDPYPKIEAPVSV